MRGSRGEVPGGQEPPMSLDEQRELAAKRFVLSEIGPKGTPLRSVLRMGEDQSCLLPISDVRKAAWDLLEGIHPIDGQIVVSDPDWNLHKRSPEDLRTS